MSDEIIEAISAVAKGYLPKAQALALISIAKSLIEINEKLQGGQQKDE